MYCWKLEKNNIIAISKRNIGLGGVIKRVCCWFNKGKMEFYSDIMIQMKILVNKEKFNKKLRFENLKEVF